MKEQEGAKVGARESQREETNEMIFCREKESTSKRKRETSQEVDRERSLAAPPIPPLHCTCETSKHVSAQQHAVLASALASSMWVG